MTNRPTGQRLSLTITVLLTWAVTAPTHGQEPTGKVRPGVWISRAEIARLPTSGAAWEHLKKYADRPAPRPDLSDQDERANIHVLARAYVYARTGAERYRTEVRLLCMAAIGTERGGRTLALGRKLLAYVVAADLVKLEPAEDRKFRAWLRGCLTENLKGRTLQSTHEDRPNNWGTHAGASRAAVAAYLGDKKEMDRVARVFKGWLGDRKAYAGFKYGDLAWQADPEAPRGINPKGATRGGRSVDGVIPDDMRRGGGYRFPPRYTKYPWGALEGAVVQAEILSRQGYDAWSWEDQAMRRAVQFLFDLDRQYPNNGWWDPKEAWIVYVINRAYGTRYPTTLPAWPGRNMSWTAWTHAPAR